MTDHAVGKARSVGVGGWITGLYAIWLREVKRAIRDRGQLIGGVVRPLLYVLIMGIGLNPYFRGEIYGEVRFVVPYTYVQFLFPAVIALNIMYTSVQSAVSVIWGSNSQISSVIRSRPSDAVPKIVCWLKSSGPTFTSTAKRRMPLRNCKNLAEHKSLSQPPRARRRCPR